MKVRFIKPSYSIETPLEIIEGFLSHIEKAGRTCYKSEDKITEDSAKEFVARIIRLGHESVIEHMPIIFEYFEEENFSIDNILNEIQEIQSETVGLNFTRCHDSVIISMNARTLRDAKRRVNNKLVNDLLMEAYIQWPVIFEDLIVK